MGLNSRANDVKYLHVFGDSIALQVREGTPDAVARENKTGKTVHELYFKSITAYIVGLSHKTTDFGDVLQIDLKDEDGTYQLSIPKMERWEGIFLKRLPNIDLAEKVEIGFFKVANPKSKTGFSTQIYVKQNDEKVESAYAKEDLPEFKKIKVKGKEQYDPTEHFDILYQTALKPAVENLAAIEKPF